MPRLEFTRKTKLKAAERAGFPRIHLGSFDNFADAVAARRAAEKAYGYHANHGRHREPLSVWS